MTRPGLSHRTWQLSLFSVVAAVAACGPGVEPADVVLVGGAVITLSEQGVVEGIAVRGNRVAAIGSEGEIRTHVGPDTRVVELHGRSVIPGLTDNHLHSIGGGAGVDLSKVRSMDELIDAIAERATQTPAGEVIVTNSDWHEGQLVEQRLPYRDDLDRAAPNHPLVVVRGGHEYILNSAGLREWGITRSTPDVPGGRIGRYADGRLNGELVDRAKDYVRLPARPVPDRSARKDALAEQYSVLNRRGLTSVRHPGSTVEQYELIRELEEEGRLDMRIDFLFRAPRAGGRDDVLGAIAEWPGPPPMGTGYEGRMVRIDGVKLGVDGGFEGGLMREPYD